MVMKYGGIASDTTSVEDRWSIIETHPVIIPNSQIMIEFQATITYLHIIIMCITILASTKLAFGQTSSLVTLIMYWQRLIRTVVTNYSNFWVIR